MSAIRLPLPELPDTGVLNTVVVVGTLTIIVALICAFAYEMRRALLELEELENESARLRALAGELRAELAADPKYPLDVDTVDL